MPIIIPAIRFLKTCAANSPPPINAAIVNSAAAIVPNRPPWRPAQRQNETTEATDGEKPVQRGELPRWCRAAFSL
jgi:hypothetical protein